MSGPSNINSYTASLRAPEGYHLPNAMKIVQGNEQVFDKFGGHPCAAGFTVLDSQNLTIAKGSMEKELEIQGRKMSQNNLSYNPVDFLVPRAMLSYSFRKEILWLLEGKIDTQLLTEVLAMDPFGQDFMLPNFAFQLNSETVINPKWLGNEQKHLKLTTVNGCTLTFFNLEMELQTYFLNINKHSVVGPVSLLWVIGKPSQNCWKGNRTIELIVDKWFLTT
jgi:single-stranded DNA-specific DHH superfamily exonuclease